MSDRNDKEEAHVKKAEDKKSNLRLKSETSAEKRDDVFGEPGKLEECSGKNPKLKKDLKQLFDNFGQDTDPQADKSPLCSEETSETVKKDITSESYSEQCVENLVSTDEFSRANNKDSFETTLDGKFIGVNDHSCNCREIKCTCSQTDHNITDIDESQMCYNHNDEPSFDVYAVVPPHHGYLVKESCEYENPQNNRSDRYNYNQVHIRHRLKERTRSNRLFPRRTKIKRTPIPKIDSGETIPQLYKANVKHLRNYGFVPEKFTFRAVTGNLPGQLEYHHSNINPGYHPYLQNRQKVNFVDDNMIRQTMPDKMIHQQIPDNIIHQKMPDNKVHQPMLRRKPKKERRCIFKQLKRNKNNDPEKTKLKYIPHNHEHASSVRRTKKTYEIHSDNNDFFDGSCLPFEENEYVSNKQLPDRIDIYCFDHLNTSYFRTCDQPPPLITDIAMEKTEEIATRFWAEIFGFIHVIIAFFIAFILQLYKFLLYSIVRPIMVGLVQLTSDYFFKPLLTITYNGFTQPFLVFLFNVAASFRDLCLPIAKGLGYFVSEIAVVLRAIRLVDCGKNTSYKMKDSYC